MHTPLATPRQPVGDGPKRNARMESLQRGGGL